MGLKLQFARLRELLKSSWREKMSKSWVNVGPAISEPITPRHCTTSLHSNQLRRSGSLTPARRLSDRTKSLMSPHCGYLGNVHFLRLPHLHSFTSATLSISPSNHKYQTVRHIENCPYIDYALTHYQPPCLSSQMGRAHTSNASASMTIPETKERRKRRKTR